MAVVVVRIGPDVGAGNTGVRGDRRHGVAGADGRHDRGSRGDGEPCILVADRGSLRPGAG